MGTVSETDFGYTGQRALGDLGLMDYHGRMYDPLLMRFIQPDTIIPSAVDPQAWDRYAYANNNPVRYNDPSGHQGCVGKNWDDGPQCVTNGNSSWHYKPDVKRQDKLFSKVFKGTGINNTWTTSDWNYYYEHRNELWVNPSE